MWRVRCRVLLLVCLGVAILNCSKPLQPTYFRNQLVSVIVFENDEKKAAELLKQGAKVNDTEKGGRTPLMYAAGIHVSDSDRQMLREGKFNQSSENIAMVKLLLDHNASVDEVTSGGNTALEAAIYHGRIDTIRLLLQYGANPNLATSSWGRTPLMLAVYHCFDDIVELLLEHGADPRIQDATVVADDAETIARKRGCPHSTVRLLTNWSENSDPDT